MRFPLMASQICKILVVDCIASYHWPQLGLINVGILNLLISIFVFVEFNVFYAKFYESKGLTLADARCPESFYLMIVFCLACHKKGLTLADARCPSLNKKWGWRRLYWWWSVYWWPYKIVWVHGLVMRGGGKGWVCQHRCGGFIVLSPPYRCDGFLLFYC